MQVTDCAGQGVVRSGSILMQDGPHGDAQLSPLFGPWPPTRLLSMLKFS